LTALSRASSRLLLTPIALAAILFGACSAPAASPSPTPVPSAVPTASPAPTASPTPTPSPTPVAAFPVTLTDDMAGSVTLAAEPKKIVSLTPAATEILFAVGAGSRTVAKAEDIDPFPPAADALPIVSTFKGVDVEKIVALGADLVVADALNPPDAITKIRGLGIPVIVLAATSIDGALHDIELVGDAVGAHDPAHDLTASMRARFDQLKAAAAGLEKVRVFYEIGGGDTIYTVPDPSIYAEMLRLAGSDPITTDSSYVIPLEKIVAADPQVILIADGTPISDVKKRAGWDKMTAVKDGAIVVIDDTLVTRPGPRLVDGLAALIAAIHPDAVVPSPVPAP
jgi:iron complex transport system substrate-binding protein